MILRTRTWKGGSTYEVTVSPEQVVDRPPLPGESFPLGEMGRVRVMSVLDVTAGGWQLPTEQRWHLRIQTKNIGPEWDNL